MVFPLLCENGTSFTHHPPRRHEARIKAGSAYDDVEIVLGVQRGDTRGRHFLDLTELGLDIWPLDRFEIILARRQTTAVNPIIGDELGAQLWVVSKTLFHLRLEGIVCGNVLGAVVQHDVEELVKAMDDLLAHSQHFLRVVIKLLLVLFRKIEVLPVGRELGSKIGRHPRRASNVVDNLQGGRLHLRENLDTRRAVADDGNPLV